MKKIVLFSTLMISILFASSCKTTKKYYYKEGVKAEKIIEAASDSAAYLEAYKNFQISKKVYLEMKEAFGDTYTSEPSGFELLDEKHKDITYQVIFQSRDSLEKSIEQTIGGFTTGLKESITESREEKHGAGAKYDTGGLYLSPIKVLSAKFVEKEYSNYKDISLRYKNVGSKTIVAIRFKWYGENAFNEPADMGRTTGWGGGFTEDVLAPGESDSGQWDILSRDGKKILIAYPYEIVFKDGTKWKLER